MIKHGFAKKEKLYSIWRGIKIRCLNKNHHAYKYYGGKGVSVYPEWAESYEVFRGWAFQNGYKEGLTLDRINGNGNYEPLNCRWVTMAQQNDNKTNTFRFDIDGKIYTITELSKKYNIGRKVIYYRWRRLGWDIKDAITKPVKGESR
jgi:hypothetical protein